MNSFDPFRRPGTGCTAAFNVENTLAYNMGTTTRQERSIVTTCSLAAELLKNMGKDIPNSKEVRGSYTTVKNIKLTHSEVKGVVNFEDKPLTARQASAYIHFVQTSFDQELQNRHLQPRGL